ncbi:hypothetical protein [Longitalea luteola]|uniref:hypothetical protein n=1 Tax=Longitalea luteola TaxID=2812563 RepID=UPI001A974856|nr:hypothetical protein [Longitalea luteola]
MIYIKLPERLKKASTEEKRNFITSDETWAFTEQPRKEIAANDRQQVTVHELFNLFTADIIQKNTLFTR